MSRYDARRFATLEAIDRRKRRATFIDYVAWAYAVVAGLTAFIYLLAGSPDWGSRFLGAIAIGLSMALVVALLLGLSAIVGLQALRAEVEVRARLADSDDAGGM